MQCPVAGFQFHGGQACWPRLSRGDSLVLRREPGNRHDPRAITVEWQGVMLGYVPREANYALSQIMDRGQQVEARVQSLRPGGDPWQRVMMEVALAGACAPVGQPSEKAAFEPSELLVRSLANRVFGSPPPPGALEWVAPRTEAIALVGIEHPALLPFLRMARSSVSPDPLAAAHALLRVAGMEPNAWKRLERWGWATFRMLAPDALSPLGIALYANLLLRMDLVSPPPPEFAILALAICRHRSQPKAPLDFDRDPMWFMHAALKALQHLPSIDHQAGLVADARCAIDWLLDARPAVDANQQHAGWAWVVGQARHFKKSRALAAKARWRVPSGEMTFGKWWVVPIRNPAELADEAAAMKNCLEDYEDDFHSGNFAVYSIRDALTTERFACFSVERESGAYSWVIEQVAGKMNRRPDDEMCAVAERAVERINAASSAASPAATP